MPRPMLATALTELTPVMFSFRVHKNIEVPTENQHNHSYRLNQHVKPPFILGWQIYITYGRLFQNYYLVQHPG